LWTGRQGGINDWRSIELRHLAAYLAYERARQLAHEPKESTRRLSSESVYLEIAAFRAFYRFAEKETLLPVNVAESLSLPRRWKRLPKALTADQIERLLTRKRPSLLQPL
jgi:site-specific recombinase XerD